MDVALAAAKRVEAAVVERARQEAEWAKPRCPGDMVLVEPELLQTPPPGLGPYCVDRYESTLVGNASGQAISPYYAPERKAATSAARGWENMRFQMGSEQDQAVPLPLLPAWERAADFEPKALSRAGVLPNGHVSGKHAETACRNGGKRLCREAEWRTACGGRNGWKFPYGESYLHGVCNVFREAHPAGELHDDPSIGHTDPRLNRVAPKGRPLLRKTGATPECASVWRQGAIYDMVGNLDEWLDNPKGVFAGGFYSRSSRDGCDWKASGHPYHYADYSTGVRCCMDVVTGRPR